MVCKKMEYISLLTLRCAGIKKRLYFFDFSVIYKSVKV